MLAFALLTLFIDDPPAKPKLSMSEGVPCAVVRGYRDYDPLEEVVPTRDDKLLVYYEPSGFASRRVGDQYEVHLVQDGKIRRRGQKAVLQAKEKILDYRGKSSEPPERVYLANTIALKGLSPGEYDLEIILRDELTRGATASQVVKFRVKPGPTPRP